jgi:hypothetical protein
VVDSVCQWAISEDGEVTGQVSEEDMHASLLELAVNVAAVAQQPGGCSEDLFAVIEDPLYLLRHFLSTQVADDEDDPEEAFDDGRYEDILWDLGINTPLPVLHAMDRVTHGESDFDITMFDEALQTIHDPDSDEDGSDEDDDSDNDSGADGIDEDDHSDNDDADRA